MEDAVTTTINMLLLGHFWWKAFAEVLAEHLLVPFAAIYHCTYLKKAISKLTMIMYCTKR